MVIQEKRELKSKIGLIEGQIWELVRKIRELNSTKKELINKYCRNSSQTVRYCPCCLKFYPRSKCTAKCEFTKDGLFLDALLLKCPRGHEWNELWQIEGKQH